MIHDIISMSAELTESESKRVLVISFDPRISPDAIAVFAAESVVNLIDKADFAKDICDPKPRGSTADAADHNREFSASPSVAGERFKASRVAIIGLGHCDAGRDDPDSDHASLCRQYLRAIEKIYRQSKILDGLLDVSDERHSPLNSYTIEDLQREAADRWPTPTEANE